MEAQTRWDVALTEVESLYRDVEKRSLSLPSFSLWPMVILLWNSFKFEFCLFLDSFLFVPVNAVIFLRNLFPGKWRYRSFSGRYWTYIMRWLWRGEAPTSPTGVIRPLVTFLLEAHFHGRINTIKRYLLFDDSLADEDRRRLGTKIARLEELWKRPSAAQVTYSYVLPISGPFIEIYKFFFPSNVPPWVSLLGPLAIGYSIAFVVSAFLIKRALMLGASGRALYFPGAVTGTGSYGKERELYSSLGIHVEEFPLDVAMLLLSILIGFVFINPMRRFYVSVGLPIDAARLHVQMLIQGAVWVALSAMVLYRRKATGRA